MHTSRRHTKPLLTSEKVLTGADEKQAKAGKQQNKRRESWDTT